MVNVSGHMPGVGRIARAPVAVPGLRAIFFALALCGAGAGPLAAAPPLLSKAQIEAAYLYNFTRFVEWPAVVFSDEHAPLVVGILGKDPFGALLDDLVAGEKIHGRPLRVRRFARVQEVGDCQVLFISTSESERVAQICATLQHRHILTVSDIPEFARRGGIIEFVQDEDRIRFRIALQRARAELLEISAKLLQPAEVVSNLPPASRVPDEMPGFTAGPSRIGFVNDFLPLLVEWARLPSLPRPSSLRLGGNWP